MDIKENKCLCETERIKSGETMYRFVAHNDKGWIFRNYSPMIYCPFCGKKLPEEWN